MRCVTSHGVLAPSHRSCSVRGIKPPQHSQRVPGGTDLLATTTGCWWCHRAPIRQAVELFEGCCQLVCAAGWLLLYSYKQLVWLLVTAAGITVLSVLSKKIG